MPLRTRNDADTGVFLRQELEQMLARSFEVQYAQIKYDRLIPISSEVDPGAESFSYEILDRVGRFKIIADKARDLPRVDITRRKVTYTLHTIGGSTGYTIKEVDAARFSGKPLQQQKMNALRRAYEEEVQRIAYWGDADTGMPGFFNNGQVDKLVPSLWFDDTNVTSDDMLEILNYSVNYQVESTNQVEEPDSLLLPQPIFHKISTTKADTGTDTTVLSYFLANNPYITSVEPINELQASKSGGNLTADRMVFYKRSPDKLEFHLPQPQQLLEPERQGLEWQVDSHATVGGTALYWPKSVLYVDKQ